MELGRLEAIAAIQAEIETLKSTVERAQQRIRLLSLAVREAENVENREAYWTVKGEYERLGVKQ